MTYTLYRLAPGSYDLDLDGNVVGGIVKNEPPERGWRAELLNPSAGMPAPFSDAEHVFLTFEQVCEWLGGVEVKEDGYRVPA